MKKLLNKFTKAVALILMVVILLSITMPMASAWQPATSVPFTDTRNHWAAHNIGWAYANNITSGTSATTFHPNRDVTRAEFVTFLHRVAGRPHVGGSNPFSDVRQGAWYVNPVTWAYTNNITSGTSATTFNPSRAITRQELATMLHRYIRNVRTDVVRADANVINGFHDRGQVSSWAVDSVSWAVHHGIIGRGGSINPQGNATRAETVTMLYRVVNTFDLPTPPVVRRALSPEEIQRRLNALLREAGTLYVNNPDDLSYWNTSLFNLLPTDGASLERLTEASYSQWEAIYLQYGLQPSGWIDSDHPSIIAKAQSITAGLDNDMDKARAIVTWIINNISYCRDIANNWTTEGFDQANAVRPSNVLETRRTVCGGYMKLTVALLRAAGIPARDIWGYFVDATISGWRGSLNDLQTVEDYLHNPGIAIYMWTGAFIDGRWVLIDTNWISGRGWDYFDMDINNITDRILVDLTPAHS